MKLGTALLVAHDIIELLVAEGLLLPNGDFTSPNVLEDAKLAAAIEIILKKYGVVVPGQVDKVIKLIPLVIQLSMSQG